MPYEQYLMLCTYQQQCDKPTYRLHPVTGVSAFYLAVQFRFAGSYAACQVGLFLLLASIIDLGRVVCFVFQGLFVFPLTLFQSQFFPLSV